MRRIFQGIGVERVFMLHSPQVASIKVERRGKVRGRSFSICGNGGQGHPREAAFRSLRPGLVQSNAIASVMVEGFIACALVQLVERRSPKPDVGGSSPPRRVRWPLLQFPDFEHGVDQPGDVVKVLESTLLAGFVPV